ncbi:DivIVA domain-containing protein [Micromonospora coxensis]|uniref:DivIVA domain-containing protein n=1 Tax=Micromonospora coxensis TaxID=356852 RepID=A0A1C5JBT6_9ACTN|nr:DivIVA domain-containing protein [Micromonospora coxensis]SCG68012.1 DivIVA domain-containing protein [Micromonospora coxensis]
MGTYRSRNVLTEQLTPEQIAAVRLPLAAWYQRGYRREEVDALLHRLAYELRARGRELEEARAENQRIKRALRTWQSERAGGAKSKRTTTARRVRRTQPKVAADADRPPKLAGHAPGAE